MGGTFKAKITVLSPVHVGSGRENLLADYDFVADGWFIRVIDQERMFEAAREEAWTGPDVDVRISRLLNKEQYKSCELYSLGNPGGTFNRIVDHIKDSHSRPYIPGSSLKGAIRTAIAWAMVKNTTIQVQERDMGRNPRFAASSVEARLFGTDPNHDMMRAFQVTDTSGIDPSSGFALSRIALYSIRDMMGKRILLPKEPRTGYSWVLETISSDAQLGFSIKLDGQLLKEKTAKRLGFDGRKDWLLDFPRHCNEFALEMIKLEADFFGKYSLPRVKSFYERLEKEIADINPETQFFLQVAWGTGWSSKTIGSTLENNVLSSVRRQFRLGKRDYPIFPKTRRLVERGNVPEAPLGWIRVDLG